MEIKRSASMQCFKTSLKNHRQPQIPKYYCVGSRRPQVLHTRIRTNCRSLNLHLFLKILLTHHCVAVAALGTQNIFLLYHQDQRDERLSVVTPYQVPTVNLFLYGDKTLSQYANTIIVESVQKFIIGTKRF